MLLSRSPGLREELQEKTKKRYQENVKLQGDDDSDGLLSFLMAQGLGEATSALMIDEDLCVGCDLCEQACAATHDGTSRMNRSAGPTHAHIHVPTSCRHCESPHCMKDCPPNAIQRMGGGGEVVIGDNCIGCGNCKQNCPYGVIEMAYQTKATSSFWQWMLFGIGLAPGKGEVLSHGAPNEIKKAVKCDLCIEQNHGPACVRACPTGAAMRLNPVDFAKLA